MTHSHDVHLHEAIRLAERSLEEGGGPFGAVVVRDGKVVGRGVNRVVPLHDPTAHAEISAIRDAAQKLGTHDLEGCTIYSSCEPCPMCLGAIHWARIESIVFGAERSDAARAGFDDSVFYDEIARPSTERRIAAEQRLRDEAVAVLEAWTRKADRIPY